MDKSVSAILKTITSGEAAISFFAKYGNTTPIKFINCVQKVNPDEFRPYDLEVNVFPIYASSSTQGAAADEAEGAIRTEGSEEPVRGSRGDDHERYFKGDESDFAEQPEALETPAGALLSFDEETGEVRIRPLTREASGEVFVEAPRN